MKALAILRAEHRVIESVLDALQQASERLYEGKPVKPAFFFEALTFIREFADGCHYMKEEGVLFEAMTAAGLSNDIGPITVMLSEHEEARRLALNMKDAAEKWLQGDTNAAHDVATNAIRYVTLLRQHIFKEDTILFPLAEKAIPPDRYDTIDEAVRGIEYKTAHNGNYSAYLELAGKLSNEMK